MPNGIRSMLVALAAAAMLMPAPRVSAEVQLLQIYSTFDGEYQAILLEDDENDGVDRFTGLRFDMVNERGMRSLVLTPEAMRDAPVLVDGKRRLLIATRQVASKLRAQVELPDAFLATDGGLLYIAPASPAAWFMVVDMAYAVRFEPGSGQPIVWNNELSRHPHASADALASDEPGLFTDVAPAPMVREYYNASLNRYVLVVSQAEKAALDFGRSGWQRTGKYFRSLGNDRIGTVPVCRVYLPTQDGHFYSAFEDDCEHVAHRPDAILETRQAFRVALPDTVTGACSPATSAYGSPVPTMPVYLAWSKEPGATSRFATRLSDQIERIGQGWMAAGYGPWGSVMCVDAYALGTIEVPKQKPRPPRKEHSP